MSEIKWTNEQKLAIDASGNNILVSASAGSGKTAVLVERVISKVLNGEIDIDKILVVTFTNASAVELKEKLLKAIYEALDKNKDNLHVKNGLKKQLKYINRATITTIHSFCLEIVRSNFYKLGIDPNFTICDESMAKLLRAKAFSEVLENEYLLYEKDSFGLYNILNLFNSKDEEFLEHMIKIYTYINSFEYPLDWLREKINKYNIEDLNKDLYNTDFGRQIYDIAISNLNVLAEKIKATLKEIENLDGFEKYVETFRLDLEIVERPIKIKKPSWDELYENLNTVKPSRFPSVKVLNEELKERIKKFRDSVFKKERDQLKTNIYAKSEDILNDLKKTYKYLEYIYSFIEKADSRYSELKKESNYIDFNDIEHFALEVLVNKEFKEDKIIYTPTEEANKYKEKFKEIYTDEYQDTSFVQEAILNAVSSKGNRFMVGDIKQSIYKFRQAMPEIFNYKYMTYPLINNVSDITDKEEGVKIILAKNFRSRKTVLSSINYIFSQIMSNEIGDSDYLENEKLDFANMAYTEDIGNDYTTEINILDVEDIQEVDFNEEALEYIKELKDFEIESKYIAKRINELVNIEKYKIFNMKKGIYEDVKYKDIVVLLRNMKDKGNVLNKTLKENNIQAFSDTNINLFDNDEVKLVLSFLKIIDNPLQDIEIVSLMYSIVGRFTLDEIYKIKSYNKKEYIYNLLKDIPEDEDEVLREKVTRFLNLLEKFKEYAKIYNVSEILARIYKETSLYNQVLILSSSNEAKINLDGLIDMANKYDSNSSIYSFITYIESLKDKTSGDYSTAKVIGENENVVRIMTIHKSKGLEFPIVFLASTNTKYNTRDMSSAVVLDHNLGIGINIIDEDKNISYPSVIKEGIKTSIERTMKSEELRMLYVALTRAKEKLFIYATMKNYNAKISSMFLMEKGGKIDEALIKQNSTYIDNILMPLQRYFSLDKNKNLFKLNIINVKSKENIENIFKNEKELSYDVGDILLENYNNRNVNTKNKIEKEAEKIKNNIDYTYNYIEDTLASKKVTVSELKKNQYDEDEILTQNLSMLKTPDCLEKKEEKYTAVRKGTLIHFILEHLDFSSIKNKEDIIKYIDRLVERNVINLRDKKQININAIHVFLNSDIGNEIKNSSLVKREVEFVLKDENISKSIIQGVIDLYYLNDRESYTLVDFKTDNIQDENEFIERYSTQLNIYKEAIEKLTNKKVSQVYIYSFKLGKGIKIYG